MYELKHKQAQRIVDKMMKDIPYNLNIMDKKGVIVGSGNKNRIGTLHKGAIEAIKQRKLVEIQKDQEFEKQGINLPIELNGEIVGVVGISGEIKKIKPFGNIVRSTVILLIEQSMSLEKENREKNKKQEFFSFLINLQTEYTQEIIQQALAYKMDLQKPIQMMYVEFPHDIKAEQLISNEIPSFKRSSHSYFFVIQEPNDLESLVRQIEQSYPDAIISISKINDSISAGYRQAKAAMHVLKGLFPNQKKITFAGYELITEISEFLQNHHHVEHLVHLLENNDELIKTLQVYVSCNTNMNETASQLIIHRNTLNYRLERIQKITGKNPKNILELIELIFMLIKNGKD